MSSLVRILALAAVAGIAFSASAGAQLLGVQALPPVSLPPVGNLPAANLPVAGPILQNILAEPAAQQAISPTLDSVSGLSGIVADSGAPTLLELRRLRLQELIRSNRTTVEPDNNGLPVRRGVVAVVDPDPAGLQRALAAGFRVMADDRDPALGMRTVALGTPRGLSAREA